MTEAGGTGSTPVHVAILAAGQGKRMFSDLPKVLHRLAGRPLLAHVVDCARTLGPAGITIVYGHGGERVRDALAAPDLQWAKQAPQLGTGHALAQAMPGFGEQGVVLVLFGDVPLVRARSLQPLIDAARDGALGVLTVDLADPRGYGRIVRDVSGRVVAIVEERDATEAQRSIREINTGILAAPAAALSRWLAKLKADNAQREYYLTDVIGFAVADGVPVVTAQPASEAEVLGINSKSQLVALERIHQRAQADALLERGAWIADPARFDLRGSLECGRDVEIDVGCVFEGDSALADRVSVGAHCVLRNVRVGPGTAIAPFSHVEDAVIGAGCRIGPFARIRPGTELADEVHIGNFVEVKASRVGARSKANHLAYVGDTTVGDDVNIGAGTITCNYDGANKHRTVIEDEVHIGSDCQLVAPVTVGRGATLGAGTTVWRDVPPGALVVNDKRQVARAGWERPRKRK